jgi:hypothetical protein
MDDDFGLWEVIVSTFWFMLLIAWFWMLINVLADLFRDRELGGGVKALWAVFILLIPWLGVLAYLLVRGDAMNARQQERALEHPGTFRGHQDARAAAGISGELRELADLRDTGVLTPVEYEQAKAKVLA